jgi:hypothetical protein
MPAIRLVAVAVAVAALTACGGESSDKNAARGGGNAAAAANEAEPAGVNDAAPAAVNDAAPAAGNQAAAAAGGLDRAFIVGRWTETDNCEETVEFRADGTMLMPWGEEARWELTGNTLTMVGNPQAITLRVTGPAAMEATKATGTVRQWRRC